MSRTHRSRLRQWFTLIFILSVTLQPVVPIGGMAQPTIAASTTPITTAQRAITDAELLTTAPGTIEVTATGIQPTMLEVVVNQTVTLLNSDTHTRRLRLSDAQVAPGYKLYLPLIRRDASGLLFAPVSINFAHLLAPTDTEIITLNAGQSVTRTFTTVGNRYVSDADTPAIPAATLLVTPLPLPKIGSVNGLVRDYQTKAPIAGANITTIESPTLQTTSDALGNYFMPLPPGAYTLVVFANGYTFANRKVTVQSFTPTGVEPLELVPLDPVVVPISAAGGVVTNSLGTTSIVVSPGAVTSTKAIRLTQLPVDAAVQNLSALPGPFVNGEMPLGFVAFEPDGTVFSAPVTWTIAYTGELPVGYLVPCYYWLEKEARWGQPVNGHVVDLGNGQKGLQAVLPHFSDYGFAPPPPPDPAPPGPPPPPDPPSPPDGPGCPKGDGPGCGSLINFISGGLSQEIATQGLPNAGGSPTQITARYRSINMAAAATFDTAFTGSSSADQYRTSTLWDFQIAGRTFGGAGKAVSVAWDKRDANGQLVPPGVIDGVLEADWHYHYTWSICGYPTPPICRDVPFDFTFTSSTWWPVSVRRADLSPFGLGWFSLQDTLLIDYGGRVSIVQADGRQVGFKQTDNGYVPPSGDFGTLVHNSDGTWTRTTPDGSTLTFNADGRLTQIADRYGNAQIVLYESNGHTFPAGSWGLTTRIRRVTDTSGNTFDYAYDVNGWLATIADSAGRIYHYEHDAAGHLTASIDPLDQRETFAYDARGLMTGHTDQRGSATTYALDDQGRLLTRTWPTNTTLQMSYTPTRTTVLNDRGAQWTTTLDANFDAVARYNGVYTQTTLFADHLPQFTTTPPQTTLYDASGNVIEWLTATQAQFERNGPFDQVTRATATDGTDTRLTYDAAGNVTSSTDALNRTYQLTYDAHGQPLSITDPLGHMATQQYNVRGQLSSTTDPLNRTTQAAYNAAGALTRIEDPLGRVTTIGPDALNRPVVITDALNGRSTMQYDAAGNLIKVIDPTSRAITYTYDALNRVTGIQSPDGGQQTLAYDALGNLTRTVDARGQTIGYQYDAHNRLINRQVQNGATTAYAYDNLDQVIGRADDVLNTTINYVPDSVDYPLNVQHRSATLPLSATLKYDYGLGYGNGGMDVPELNLNLTPPVKNVGAQATPYVLPIPPTRFVGTGTPGSCSDLALATALSGGGVIGFECGASPVTITFSAVKVITAPTTLDGGNLVTLDGNNAVGLFSVTNGAALTVTNLTLMRAKCQYCGAIEVKSGARLNSINAVFTANQWGGWSGAAIDVYGTADVISTTFTNNANYDGAGGPAPIVLLTQMGGFGPVGVLTVTHSLFRGNLTGGIGVDSNASASVVDTVFEQNTGYAGGAIRVSSGAATIDDAVFVGNRALNNNLNLGNGGAIYSNGVVTVTHSWFISNTTTGSGGAIESNNGLASIAASTFVSNSAANSGGAIFGPGQVRDSVFVNNRASDSGALYAGGLVSITASIFVSNAATSGSGGAINLYNPLTVITDTTLLSNTASGSGGGLYASYYASSGNIQLSNVSVVGNIAGTQGGGLYLNTNGNYVTLNIAHLTAANNRTLNGGGGGVWVSAIGLMLSDSLFSQNTANGTGQSGGGLYTYNNAANATISHTVFFHNQASDPAQCGGWYAAGLNNVISHSSFTGNSGTALCALSPLTATLNYWGAANGPYHDTLNPAGQGDKVGNGVLFTPWNPAFFFLGDGRMHGLQLTTNDNPVQTVRLTHDAVGQLTSLNSRGYATYTLAYAYDPAGRLIQRSPIATAPLTNVYEYDAASAFTRLAISGPSGSLLSEAYAYDAAGNLTQTTSSRDGVSTYAYDALNRLIGVNSPGFSAAYGYDAVGNRTSAGGVTYTYDAGGRLISASDGTTYGYDAAGNLIKRIQPGQMMTLTWDTQSRLTRIDYSNGTYSAYQYDAVGRRISKRLPDGTLIYYVYVGDDLAQELDGSGVVIASYIYDGLDRPISLWRRTNGANGATYYYLLDHLGTVLGLTDADGNVVATYRYDPWGNVISSTGTLTNPLRFTSREYDAESGLYFYRARYYDPQAGRFISRDPIGLEGGLNLYAYANNAPNMRRDPFGLDASVWLKQLYERYKALGEQIKALKETIKKWWDRFKKGKQACDDLNKADKTPDDAFQAMRDSLDLLTAEFGTLGKLINLGAGAGITAGETEERYNHKGNYREFMGGYQQLNDQ